MQRSYQWYLNNSLNEYWSYSLNVFAEQECDEIIKLGDQLIKTEGRVNNNTKNKEQRDSDISWLSVNSDTEWIFRKLTDAINYSNKEYFFFDLESIGALQYTTYKKDQFYNYHLDTEYAFSGQPRKLSFSVQLSDPKTYEGGDLALAISDPSNPVTMKRDRGSINFFPSFLLHKVEPITKGERKSLVGWVTGPRFK